MKLKNKKELFAGDGTELVRHFLIEPSPKGVKLKGCNNEVRIVPKKRFSIPKF